MAHEEEVFEVVDILKVTDRQPVGDILANRLGWRSGTSAANQAFKALCNLASVGRIEKHRGFFRMPGTKSDYGIHDRLTTGAISQLLICRPGSIIYREHTIAEVGLRPDILALIVRGQEARCAVIELANFESESSLVAKRHVWDSWAGGAEYLSRLFGYRIPHFEFIALREGESVCDKLSLT